MSSAVIPSGFSVNLLEGLGRLVLPDSIHPLAFFLGRLGPQARLAVLGDRQDRLSQRGIPAPEQIPISAQLRKDHPLAEFIDKDGHLTFSDFSRLFQSPHIDLSIRGYDGGAVGAAVPSEMAWNDLRRYDRNLWLRDWALDFFAVHRSGHIPQSHQMIRSVMNFFGSSEHRSHVTGMHFEHTDPAGRFYRNERSIHSKFSIAHDGSITWCKTPWAHQQLDAFTSFVNAVYRAANLEAERFQKCGLGEGAMPLDLRTVDPLPGSSEHILPALIKALKGIRIWEASDVGPWEDFFAHQRTTANGLATSMSIEIRKFHQRYGWNFLNVDYGHEDGSVRFKSDVDLIARNCKQVLDSRVPESGYAVECDKRPHDAAMLLLLYPFRADLSPDQELSILRTVYANMGEVGFSRFLMTLDRDLPRDFNGDPSSLRGTPDLFVGQDYHRNTDPQAYGEFSKNVPDYRPAEWGIFDALLSGYYYRRYIESGGLDVDAFRYGDRHIRRCLAFVVKEDSEIFIEGKKAEANGGVFSIHKGSFPEAMFWDSRKGEFLHNHNDLLMSRAALALAFERAREASRLYEEVGARISAEL